jgi:adenylate kinase
MYNLVFLGAPGAGKGTQATIIAQKLDLIHLATGDLFRQAVKRGDKLGQKVKSFLKSGELVPDEITIEVVLKQINNLLNKGFILDGFPRNINQAKSLDEALGAKKKAIDKVIFISVSQSELEKRLGKRKACTQCQVPYQGNGDITICPRCGGELVQRSDDKPETISNRLKIYLKETEPLVYYYNQENKLNQVSGEGKIRKITNRILKVLGENQ